MRLTPLALLLSLPLLLVAACEQPAPSPTAPAGPSPTVPPPTSTLVPSSTATPAPTLVPSPTPVPTPVATATATPSPTPVARAPLPDAPDRDLFDLTRRLVLKLDTDIPRVVSAGAADLSVGSRNTFWITDIVRNKVLTSTAVLRYVTPHAYWYVEEGVAVPDNLLRSGANTFEQRIYPAVARAFGEPWTPGVDGDPRMTVLHARIPGVAGYYSSADEYPTQVHPYSNQREMIYINVGAYPVGGEAYLSVLAHELQHAAHWVADPAEETWANEGLSELAADTAGYPPASENAFMRSPSTSLVHWSMGLEGSTPHYGAAYLFMAYLAAHYGKDGSLLDLVRRPEHGLAGVDAFLRATGAGVTSRDVFAGWVIANLLDEKDGPYSYPGQDVRVAPQGFLDGAGSVRRSVPQYAADYVELRSPPADAVLSFAGPTETPLLPVAVPEGGVCWWGNRGDNMDATLTGRFRLPSSGPVTLELTLWYDTEEFWDYAYVEVSTDGGRTWDILPGGRTSPANPVGNSFGPGYTGRSDGWVTDTVDLTAYAGRDVLLRFEYVADDTLHGDGPCIARIAIPQMGWQDSGAPPPGFAWDARGFVRIDNITRQEYVVQVVEYTEGRARVRSVPLDAFNRGEVAILGIGGDIRRVVVVVAALSGKTAQPAPYTLEVRPAR